MNVSRLVAFTAGHALSASESGVAFHLCGDFEAPSRAREQNVHETSVYPWSGDIRIAIDPETRAPFDLRLCVRWGRRRDGADQLRGLARSRQKIASRTAKWRIIMSIPNPFRFGIVNSKNRQS
jgi:hypothetical protein